MNYKSKWSMITIILVLLVVIVTYYEVYGTSIPTIKSAQADVVETKATLTGILEDNGGQEITRYGFKWGASSSMSNEEILENKIKENTSFSITIDGLQEGTKYYYQAFAVNTKGYSYGETKSFTVPVNASPEVTISSPGPELTLTKGQVSAIFATATDDNKVQAMELYINDILKTTAERGLLIYTLDTTSLNPGQYVVKVTASDGAKSDEKTIALTVCNCQVKMNKK